MKVQILLIFTLLGMVGKVHAYEGPSPLRNLKLGVVVKAKSSDIYTYEYSIANPAANDGKISSVDIFLGQNKESDVGSSNESRQHCSSYFRASSTDALKSGTVTGVGSTAPPNWTCGYGKLAGFDNGSYGWGAKDVSYMISPGKSQSGFSLISSGLPSIREVLIEPWIDLDQLPSEYDENAEKTEALESKVRWIGKTIGPKAPPKIFVPTNFLEYLISLKDQSISLGWISGKELERDLNKIFAVAKKHLGPCDQRKLKAAIGELIEKAKDEKKCKGLSSEGRALLLYNSKYFLAQLPSLSKADKKECERDEDHDHHEKHEDSNRKN